MKLPDWLFRRLERAYLAESRRRQEESRRRLAEEDRRVRYFYDWARFGHQMGHHFPDCPYAGCRF